MHFVDKISHSYVSHVPDFFYLASVKKKSYYCKYTRVTSSGHLSKLQTFMEPMEGSLSSLEETSEVLLNPMYMTHGVLPLQYP